MIVLYDGHWVWSPRPRNTWNYRVGPRNVSYWLVPGTWEED